MPHQNALNCSLTCYQNASMLYEELRHNTQDRIIFFTLEYLLYSANNGTGAVGLNNAVNQDSIVQYINHNLNLNLITTSWQSDTLQTLKDRGLVATKIYPPITMGVKSLHSTSRRRELKI